MSFSDAERTPLPPRHRAPEPSIMNYLVLQPHDHQQIVDFVSELTFSPFILPDRLDDLTLQFDHGRHTLTFQIPLDGFSAWIRVQDRALHVWPIEPDFSAPWPHLSLAFPWLADALGGEL
jgi:hypothetical protein